MYDKKRLECELVLLVLFFSGDFARGTLNAVVRKTPAVFLRLGSHVVYLGFKWEHERGVREWM